MRKLLSQDEIHGELFRDVPIVERDKAAQYLKPGDIFLHYIPILPGIKNKYSERLLRGVMHVSMIAASRCGGKLFRGELPQRVVSGNELFDENHDENLKRFLLVLRHKKADENPKFAEDVGKWAFKYMGYVFRKDEPVLDRKVKLDMFAKSGKGGDDLPGSLLCFEQVYLAYKKLGIRVCDFISMQEMIDMNGGLPPIGEYSSIMKSYSSGNPLLYMVYLLFYFFDTAGSKLKLNFLRPGSFLFREFVYPEFILNHSDFELKLIIVP